MLIGSLVELYVGLHSYLCFSPLKKLFWKAGSTPPRYLAIFRAFQAFFLTQSWHLLNTCGSIEKAPASLITPRHLVDWLSFCSWNWVFVARYLLNTSAIDDHFLDTSFDTSRNLSYRALLKVLFNLLRDLSLISSISLDLSTPVHLLNILSFTPNLFLKFSSSFFKFFYTW